MLVELEAPDRRPTVDEGHALQVERVTPRRRVLGACDYRVLLVVVDANVVGLVDRSSEFVAAAVQDHLVHKVESVENGVGEALLGDTSVCALQGREVVSRKSEPDREPDLDLLLEVFGHVVAEAQSGPADHPDLLTDLLAAQKRFERRAVVDDEVALVLVCHLAKGAVDECRWPARPER